MIFFFIRNIIQHKVSYIAGLLNCFLPYQYSLNNLDLIAVSQLVSYVIHSVITNLYMLLLPAIFIQTENLSLLLQQAFL